MATTRPGKLSSKFGAAFAAFEKNSSESNVPQAFRSATIRKKTTRPSWGGNAASKQNDESSNDEEKPKTRFSERNSFQRRSINADDVSGSKSKPEQQATQAAAEPNGAEQTQSTPPNSNPSPVKRNFRVSSKLANRAKMFESSNNNISTLPTNGNTAYQNARHGLRKVKQQQPSVEQPAAATESSSEPVSHTETKSSNDEKYEIVPDSTDLSNEDDNDDNGSECYVEYIVKDDSAHSTIVYEYSDDESEDEWEEETVDATVAEEDDCSWQSWEEETIEDDEIFEEEEYLLDDKSL